MPSLVEPMPGTARHQALLRTIVEAYEHDERVLAVGVLGSLGRGTWDEWSDLDLDVVIADDAVLDAVTEAHALCEALRWCWSAIRVTIAPVITGDSRRWQDLAAGPQRAAPEALVAACPESVTR